MTADRGTWAHGLPPHGFWVRSRGKQVTLVGWSGHLGWLSVGLALLVLGLCGLSLGLIARRSGLLFPTVIAMLACLAGAFDELRAGRGGWHLLLGFALCLPLVLLWRWLAGAGAWAVVLGCVPLAMLGGLLADGYIVRVSARGLRVTETALLIPTRTHRFPLDCVIEPYVTLDSDEPEGVAVRDASRPDSEICLGTARSAHALREALEQARARYLQR